MNGACWQPDTRLVVPFMPTTRQLPLPVMAEVSVMEFEPTVTFTLRFLPDSVAATVGGACLGPISYFSRSALISARRHSHCALVVMVVPSCMTNGLGSFLFCAESRFAAVALQPAKLSSPVLGPLPPLPVVPAALPPVPVVPPRPPAPV